MAWLNSSLFRKGFEFKMRASNKIVNGVLGSNNKSIELGF